MEWHKYRMCGEPPRTSPPQCLHKQNIAHTRIMRSCSSCTSRRWNSVAALNIVLPALGPRQGPGAAGWGRSIKFPFHPSRKGAIDTFVSWTGCDVGGRSALLLLGWSRADCPKRVHHRQFKINFNEFHSLRALFFDRFVNFILRLK